MARRPTAPTRLNAANLTRLGAPRLAELLAEASVGDANLKRRLRLELAAEAGPDRLAAEIDKRIAALAAARVRVSWRKRGELIRDLEAHRRMIVDRLAPADARAAFASLLAWFDLFRGLTARVQDPRGELVFAFEDAAPDLWTLAGAPAGEDPAALDALAEAVGRHPQDYARWIGAADDALTPEFARRLLAALPSAVRSARPARGAIRRLADRAGDLDLWLSLATPEEKGAPDFAAGAARRLLAAGRIGEARAALETALRPSPSNRRWTFGRNPTAGRPALTPAWELASIDVQEAEGNRQEAQDLRWAMFERDLSPQPLRDYLARLPDFDDVEALDRAFAQAAASDDFGAALGFLMDWPAHREAAAMVLERRREAQRPWPRKAEWAARLLQRYPEAAEALGG
ncbi:MAG: DUF6880 family protein [Brevundimonas sp.]|jgi:hypothetical protein|uniref:Uncharacterized protein n=3 Tax=Brevundimonas TaxID=41275 RepID=A0A2X1BRS8_BREVE|nr:MULTISPECIES: DUF6880 family protein [Brevundimonas]SPU53394.1 Uncharacterised protein [Brevundimonas vesicularis]